MRYCTECGHQIPNEAKFCSRCGKPTTKTRPGVMDFSATKPQKTLNTQTVAKAPVNHTAEQSLKSDYKKQTKVKQKKKSKFFVPLIGVLLSIGIAKGAGYIVGQALYHASDDIGTRQEVEKSFVDGCAGVALKEYPALEENKVRIYCQCAATSYIDMYGLTKHMIERSNDTNLTPAEKEIQDRCAEQAKSS